MKTLKELIAEGLPVGALVEGEISGDILQYLYPKRNGGQFYDFRFGDEAWFEFSNMEYKPTTAYDSQIAPETLPIPEPFWTGWAIRPNAKGPKEIHKISTYAENQGFDLLKGDKYIVFMDSYGAYKSDCKPCLPPA